MLFQITDDYETLEPQPFSNFEREGHIEKKLESLIAQHLFGVLFEDNRLMPLCQERQWQSEADIYALDENGDVIVFELKRSVVEHGALDQVLRYAEDVSQWSYEKMEKMYRTQPDVDGETSLTKAHAQAFDLSEALRKDQFNRRQRLRIIGSGADQAVVAGVDYWKRQGLDIDLLPYRLYKFNGKIYFEFFAKPYDLRTNPADRKGILFDTCRKHLPNALQWMLEGNRVAAYGTQQKLVERFEKDDYVFLWHVGFGIVAAGQVKDESPKPDTKTHCEDGESYRDVEFVTPPPSDYQQPEAMPVGQVREVCGRNFFWASTVKTPYLSREEAEKLLDAVKECLGDRK